MNKKLLYGVCAGLTLASLCAGSAMAEDAAGSLHINWLSARSADEATILAIKDIAAAYQEENPDLDFSFEVENISDRTSYLQKLKILAASDELPEWYDSDPDTWFADIVSEGKAYNIEDLYKELGIDGRVFEISKEYGRLSSGDLNLMTFQCNTEFFFYNKGIFEEVGISEPATFDEFFAACDTILEAGYTPISMGGDWPILRYFAMVPFRLSGNDYIESAVTQQASFGEEAGLEGAAFMQKLNQYFQTGWTSADYDTMVDLFASGQTAMLYNGTWCVADLVDEATGDLREDIGYFTMPTYSDNDATAATDFFANSGIGTAVETEAMTDEMKDFIGYMLNHYAEASLSYNQLPSVMPDEETLAALPSIYQSVLECVSGVTQYAKCWDVVIDSASVESLEKETTNLVLGASTPEEWAENMDDIVSSNIG